MTIVNGRIIGGGFSSAESKKLMKGKALELAVLVK